MKDTFGGDKIWRPVDRLGSCVDNTGKDNGDMY